MKENVEKLRSDAADDATNENNLTAICWSLGYFKPLVSQYCVGVVVPFSNILYPNVLDVLGQYEKP